VHTWPDSLRPMEVVNRLTTAVDLPTVLFAIFLLFFTSFSFFLFLIFHSMLVVNRLPTAVDLPTVLFSRLPFLTLFFCLLSCPRDHGRCPPLRYRHRPPYCTNTHTSLWQPPPPPPPHPIPRSSKVCVMCVCFLFCGVSHTTGVRAFIHFKLHLIVREHQGQVYAGTNSQKYSM
jgi:hypothetical protein